MQAPAPERLITGGLATPVLLAQVLASMYCDHTPLYRQSQIFPRYGVDLPRSTLAGWVVAPAGGSKLFMSVLFTKSVFASNHTRRCRCSIPVVGASRRAAVGLPASNAPGLDRSRRRRSICLRRTARPNARPRISSTWPQIRSALEDLVRIDNQR